MALMRKPSGDPEGAKPRGQGSSAPKQPQLEQKVCPTCHRKLVLGASTCPFCTPQHCDEADATLAREFEQHKEIPGFGGVIAAQQLAVQHKARGFLHVYEGTNKGLTVLLLSQRVTMGRGSKNLMPLNDKHCSFDHAEVRPHSHGFLLLDAGSKNGTYVNDQRVQEKDLADGDLILIGSTRIYAGILK